MSKCKTLISGKGMCAWGGKRSGAGRPRGAGRYKEETKPMRIPVSKISLVTELINEEVGGLPLFTSKVAAGFPSPADEHMEERLDLNNYLIKNPAATFFVRASGLSMINAGIYPDDILVVDKSLEPQNGKIVIAAVEGELTVKRLYRDKGKVCLLPENDEYQPIDVSDKEDVVIWGVVTNVIHGV
jgi:DNA polymerase V